MKFFFYCSLLIAGASMTSCNNDNQETADKTDAKMEPTKPFQLKEETVNYTGDGVNMVGYVAYDENKEGSRPAILVVPEWWGLTDYVKGRAKQLAELGYIAMAVDFYGNGKVLESPDSAGKYATPFYQNPQMAKARFDAAMAKLKSYSQADPTKFAAIGYCFGGTQVLNMAKMGEDLKAVVSFHGGLEGVPADKNLLRAEILVCHGGADSFVPKTQVDQFRKQMDSIGAKYKFITYEGATHAFTNPGATEKGKKYNMPIQYNAAADSASWRNMKDFFSRTL